VGMEGGTPPLPLSMKVGCAQRMCTYTHIPSDQIAEKTSATICFFGDSFKNKGRKSVRERQPGDVGRGSLD